MSGFRRLGLAVSAALLIAAAPVPAEKHVRLQLDALPVSELVTVLYRDVLRVPYLVSPEVSNDHRTVSIRLDAPVSMVRAQIVAYLKGMGLLVQNVAGIDQIRPASGLRSGSGVFDPNMPPSPLAGAYGAPVGIAMPPEGGSAAPSKPIDKPAAPVEVGFYQPRFRDAAYLSDVLKSVFPELRFGSRATPQADQSHVDPTNGPDALVYAGSAIDVAGARKLVAQLDTEQSQLSIKATVYEVQTGHTNQSAISVALSLIGGKVLGAISGASPVLDTFARLKTRNVDAVVSVLNSDSRFKVVTSPSVRTRSGAQAVLTSGSQVPVLGAVSYQGDNSTPVQSVEYRDSGVILKVRPVVHRDVIDVDVSQELSNFVNTTTGVNTSPTLIKRSLANQLSLRSGDVVVLGGLTEDRATKSHSGLLKGWIGQRDNEVARTEILLVLQVEALGGETDRPQRSEDGKDRAPSPTSL